MSMTVIENSQYKWEYKVSNHDVAKYFHMYLGDSPRKIGKIHWYHLYDWEENWDCKNMVYVVGFFGPQILLISASSWYNKCIRSKARDNIIPKLCFTLLLITVNNFSY